MMIHGQISKPNWNVLSVISVRIASSLVVKQQKRMFMMNWSASSASTVPEIPHGEIECPASLTAARIAVLIPCLNEEVTISKVVQDFS
jgi:hypothetical protein